MVDERKGRKRGRGVAGVALKLARDAELPVLVLDPRRRTVRAVNRTFLDVFDRDADELLGERYDELVGEGDGSRLRDLVSIAAYGGAKGPQDATFVVGADGDEVDVSLVGVPNVLEDPTAPVAVLCRPRGELVGKPIGPPEILHVDGDGLDRIPPRRRVKEDRRMNETSRSLWD